MKERFAKLPPLVKTILVIIVLALIVWAASLMLFPEWRTVRYWPILLLLAAIVGVAALLDQLSGARNLFVDVTTAPPQITEDNVQALLQQTTNAILQQLDPSRLTLSPDELERATKSYLAYLVDRYQILDFKGMGVDRVIALPLLEMYVPLKARVELPKGETWDRSLKVGGGDLPQENQHLSEPQPVLDLLQQHEGLVILGDPGAGKTTFLKYLAVRLALGQSEALGIGNRLPILLPLSAYARALDEEELSLDDFISCYYNDQGIELPLGALFEETLRQGRALFLLDGLDEVQSLKQRGLVVDRFLTYFSYHRQAGNKFAITSRIIGYDEVRLASERLKECTLIDFDRDEIEDFIDKWTAALEKAARGGLTATAADEAQREKQELLAAIDQHAGVRRLATNPLLLTILALMKRQGVTLPERRVELYDKYIETLVRHWNLARGLDRRAGREIDYGTTVHVLAELALWMHQNNPGLSLAPQEAVKRQLVTIYHSRGVPEPESSAQELLRDAREYAGLLVERGQRAYGFIHLTFQEYLAAVGIAQQEDEDLEPVVSLLANHVGDDNWHEVILLAVGYIGIIQQREKPASRILQQLITREPGEPGEALVLAGQAVADMSPGGVTPQFKEVIASELLQAMQSEHIHVQRRAQAGSVIGQMARADGRPLDDRRGVSYVVRDGIMIPDIVWGEIVPAGEYTIGDEDPKYSNAALRPASITVGYQLAKYPVTVAQFACFADAEDVDEERWWAGMPDDERYRARITESRWSLSNRPRETVAWYQAVAFCRWLDHHLKMADLVAAGEEIDLPHENEWEVAARYAGNGQIDRRTYPWGGDAITPDHANYGDTGLRETSAVGLFPAGRQPELGLYDLSGNVWEWCRNKYQKPEDTVIDKSGDSRTSRGGSWFDDQDLARAAFRSLNLPPYRGGNIGFRLVRRLPSHPDP